MSAADKQLAAIPAPRTSAERRPLAVGTTAPVLTATAEDFVWLTDFAAAGSANITAFAFLDNEIGMRVIVDERLDPAARKTTIDAALDCLLTNCAKRFVVLDARGELIGGAA